jgi:hypothetical protein
MTMSAIAPARQGGGMTSNPRLTMHRPLVLAAIVAVILVACGGTAAGSAAPSGGPSAPPSIASSAPSSPSAVPSTPVAASPSAPIAPDLAKDSIALVVTDGLRVRSQPRVAADSAMLTPLLDHGRRVYVVDGPVSASGYVWYEIVPIRTDTDHDDLPFGWVAAGKDGEPWLSSEGFTCPALPADYATFATTPPLIALACFGHKSMSIAARIANPEATCGVSIGWDVDPSWLFSTCPQPPFLLEDPTRTDLSLNAVLDPKVDIHRLNPGPDVPEWLRVTVTGRFDHPAARTCHGVSDGEKVPLTPTEIVLDCRATFVISALKAAG